AAPSPMDSYNHFETLSVATSSSLPNTRAATAEGANPTTEDEPWCCDQMSLTAAIADVLPVPAGPMTADRAASEVSNPRHARSLSALSGWPPAIETVASCVSTRCAFNPCPAEWVAASMMNCSWSMMVAVV